MIHSFEVSRDFNLKICSEWIFHIAQGPELDNKLVENVKAIIMFMLLSIHPVSLPTLGAFKLIELYMYIHTHIQDGVIIVDQHLHNLPVKCVL